MKKYYKERKGLLSNELALELDDLLEFFSKTYHYYRNKNCFECAIQGAYIVDKWTNEETQLYAPTLAPSPEVFFANHLQDKNVWPINEYVEDYTEEILFTVIEILYDHIGIYNFQIDVFEQDKYREEFSEMINNILKMYDGGYYLEPSSGFIMRNPNQALRNQLQEDCSILPDDVLLQLRTATKMYYRYDSNFEEKKKAINILVDILENVRNDLKEVLSKEYEVNKNDHDKLIFNIVNSFNIRHNNDKQMTDYDKKIWYEWMMQYYSSVILTYFKLIKTNKSIS